MKNFIRITSVVLVFSCLVIMFASCSGSNAVKSAFEKAGWNVEVVDANNNVVEKVLESISGDAREYFEKCEIIVVSKGLLDSAIIFKFPSANDIKSALTVEGNTSAYDEAKEEGYIKGDCLFVNIIGDDALEIFKNA